MYLSEYELLLIERIEIKKIMDKLSTSELLKELKMSASQWSAWKNQKRSIKVSELVKIKQFLYKNENEQ